MKACPSEEVFLKLLSEELAEPVAATLHGHIEDCPTCRALLAEMGRAVEPSVERDPPVVDADCYKIEAHLSSGGLGNIFRARDLRLGREVAIKQLRVDSADALVRFRREALVTSRLQHPAIVPVYEAGRWPSGEPFYAMKLVAGRSLQEVIADTATLDERLALLPKIIIVADAIAYAHAEGVIHRDLKPANILVGAFGETVVIDWGLARRLSDAEPTESGMGAPEALAGLTVAGTIIGTPAYMPPEQARAEAVDERADVYALGAVLYNLLAGVPPYQGLTSAAIVAKVLAEEPPPVDDLVPEIPEDLAAIIHKAMARQPADRYPSAKELATDLERFQAGRLVSARRYSRGTLLVRWLGRNRMRLAVAALLLLGLSGTVVANVQRLRRMRNDAVRRRNDLILAQARSALLYDPTAALAWVKAYLPDGTDLRAAHEIATTALSLGTARHIFHGPPDQEANVVVSPDGALIARGPQVWDVAARTQRSLPAPANVTWLGNWISHDGSRLIATNFTPIIHAWDLRTGRHQQLVGSGEEWNIGLTSDEKWLVAGGSDGIVRRFAFQSGETRVLGRHQGAIFGVVVSPADDWAATICADGHIGLWRVDGSAQALLAEGEGYPNNLAWSPDGRWFVTGGSEGAVKMWNLGTRAGREVVRHSGNVLSVAVSADGKWVASGGQDGIVRAFNVVTGARRELHGHEQTVRRVAFLPDGELATGGGDRTVRLWDLTTGAARKLVGLDSAVTDLGVSDDGRTLATATDLGTVQVWRLPPPPRVLVAATDDSPFPWASASADGRRLVWSGRSRQVHLVDVATGETRRLPLDGLHATRQALTADATTVATWGDDGTLRLWDFARAESRWSRPSDEPLATAEISADGAYVASASASGHVRLWTLASGELHTGTLGPFWRATLRFSADSRWLYGVNGDRLVLWNTSDGRERIIKIPETGNIASYGERGLMSPDNKWVVASGHDGSILLVDVAAGTTRVLGRHTGTVAALAWSADGRKVATGALDRVILVCDVVSGSCAELRGHEGLVRELAFSPDGARLASAGYDNVIRIWDLGEGLQRRILRGHTDTPVYLAFSADGGQLRSLGCDRTVRDWSLRDAAESPPIAQLSGWLEELTSAAVGSNEKIGSLFRSASGPLSGSPQSSTPAGSATGSDRAGFAPAAPGSRTPPR
jgi:WD40 repeat protein